MSDMPEEIFLAEDALANGIGFSKFKTDTNIKYTRADLSTPTRPKIGDWGDKTKCRLLLSEVSEAYSNNADMTAPDIEKLAKVREAVGWAVYKINSRTEAHEAGKYINEALSILDSMGVK